MVKKSMKKLFVGLAAFSYAATMSASADALSTSKNFFQPRAFSANLAREMLLEGSKHRDSEGWYGEFSADAAYQRSWNQGNEQGSGVEVANGLGTYPFWSNSNVMTLGSNLDNADLDVYQFGLGPVAYAAGNTITLNPLVYQAGADFMFVVGSSANEPCFFAKIKAPVGVYNINPNLTEESTLDAVIYPLGQMGTAATTADIAATMTQAFAGNLAGGQASGQQDFIPMKYGLINGDQSTGAKFGDIEMTAGYRFISNEDNSFSVAVRAAAPTGGQATGQFMMEPLFGRGGNWGLGGYLDGHVRVWQGNNENSMVLKFMANAMHLFSTDTVRSYDLTLNGGGSKYLLVGSFASNAYNSQVQNLINVSTLASTSSFGVEGDAVVSFSYIARGWSWDLGYEFWGRSAETLEITGDLAANTYAVLGRQYVADSGSILDGYCQPLATISASAAAATTTTVPAGVQAVTASGSYITLADFNVIGAQQDTALTSKVFTKVTYEWIDSNYRPHLGVMGEFEISTSNNNALPQWAIALMGGVSF
jgi:hypothetical protein